MLGNQKHSHPPPCALPVVQVSLQVWGVQGAGARRGRGATQVSDVASAKERRARWVCWVVLTCSSATLYNLSGAGCLCSAFYQVECLEMLI